MFEALLPVVHRFSMNAYDYQTPGPNAPFAWLRMTLDALADAEKEKLLLGLPFYGYDNSGTVAATELPLRLERKSLLNDRVCVHLSTQTR